MSGVIELLRDLVAIPSVNPSGRPPDDRVFGERRVVDYLEDLLRRHGIDCVRQEALRGRENLLARVDGRAPEPIILEAHTDTVSVDGMEIEPFDPRLADGRVYGRGACDDKASLAAMVTALLRIAARGTPERTCLLAATCDEEFGFNGVKAFLAAPEVAGLSRPLIQKSLACAGEPTQLGIVIAHKGAFRWHIRTRGRSAHSSEPEKGDNAIYKMARVISALEQYALALRERPRHPLVGAPAFSVGRISGGTAVNIVPETCEIQVDRRLIPGEDGEAVAGEIRAFLEERVGDEVELSTLLVDWPLETPADAEVVRRAQSAAVAVGTSSEPIGVQYGTDASKMAREGVQCIVCGPGHIAQAHTAVEWVEVAQVETAADFYEHFLAGPHGR